MSTMRISKIKCLYAVTSASRFDIRPPVAYSSKFYHTVKSENVHRSDQNSFGKLRFRSSTFSQYFDSIPGNSPIRGSFLFLGSKPLINPRCFASASEGNGRISKVVDIAADSGANVPTPGDGGVNGDDWVHKFKEMWQSTVDASKFVDEKVKDASNEVSPHVQQLLDTHPYLRDVIVPTSCTLTGILLVWFLLPRLFRRFHKYSVEGPGALLFRASLWHPVPYEKSFWGALENPVRYFVSLMAILQIGTMVAPSGIIAQYATPVCRGAFTVSLVWFLHRWKSSVIARALAADDIDGAKRDQWLAFDRISSVGLLVVGTMALAEAAGVAVQSILTVGGVGGVATAFAARDVLGNVLSGLSIQFSQPFSVGDTIKAGSVEGQVVQMGLTTTSLLTDEKFPVFVPNSLFSSQVIINKSRAEWRSMVQKIPLQIDDIDKISQISEDIKSMLRSNANVFLEKEAPYCFLSLIERSYAELTLGCNLKQVSKEVEQNILVDAVRIIKQHGVILGTTH